MLLFAIPSRSVLGRPKHDVFYGLGNQRCQIIVPDPVPVLAVEEVPLVVVLNPL